MRLRAQCAAEGLRFIAIDSGPDAWEDDDNYRMQADALHVHSTFWYFRAQPKHCDYSCETQLIDFEHLFNALRDHKDTGFLAWQKDVLLADGDGRPARFLEELVEAGELDDSYLDQEAGI